MTQHRTVNNLGNRIQSFWISAHKYFIHTWTPVVCYSFEKIQYQGILFIPRFFSCFYYICFNLIKVKFNIRVCAYICNFYSKKNHVGLYNMLNLFKFVKRRKFHQVASSCQEHDKQMENSEIVKICLQDWNLHYHVSRGSLIATLGRYA